VSGPRTVPAVTPDSDPGAAHRPELTPAELTRRVVLLGADPADLVALAGRLRTSMSFPGGCVDVAGTFRADVVAAATLVDAFAALLGDTETAASPAVVAP
jgi:hypothetical protein